MVQVTDLPAQPWITDTAPLSPSAMRKAQSQYIPTFVFRAINKLIALNLNAKGTSATFKQKDLILEIIVAQPGPVLESEQFAASGRQIIDRGWLNFESAYEQLGWKVTYDRPAFNEQYEATFTFTEE